MANTTFFIKRAKALYPWMPQQLIKIYADSWIEFDSPELAIQDIRNGQGQAIYDSLFPGIRRDDGSLRMNEAQYFSYKQNFNNTVAGFGLNPEVFESKFIDLLEQEVQFPEFERRMSALYTNIISQGDEVTRAFTQASGVPFNIPAAMAVAMDPGGIGADIFNRNISLAQIQGAAKEFGFRRNTARAERILDFTGMDIQAAREFYGEASRLQRNLDPLAKRYDPRDRSVGINDLEDALVFNDVEHISRIERLLSRERSAFSSGSGVVASNDMGAAIGLGTRR